MAAKNSAQLAAISAPAAPAAAQPCAPSRSCASRPVPRHQAHSAAAPNTQRPQTSVSGSVAASSTKRPSVPSSSPPAAMRSAPLRASATPKPTASVSVADAAPVPSRATVGQDSIFGRAIL